mmetsp:Transcript_44899/g.54381  ORF Transcript_44899/g.54381 Transcript_44899/m.54381 type:complete len:301 (-) Transcript_44899:158-1060(-)|eukprot:CAMPEP_0172511656 /NCGR_PEP_ID=MMETSP1066-20121228/237971_1 /TAXON_ID=671091 /ORGANISM="Coscinodiscus wailesii, Strain CCMP2513" /LENGTH=300 /DNA_ID=CAMNT_0013291121 /DNA_START=97 /DNA_END=999 /DNA_ORIENTATION=-
MAIRGPLASLAKSLLSTCPKHQQLCLSKSSKFQLATLSSSPLTNYLNPQEQQRRTFSSSKTPSTTQNNTPRNKGFRLRSLTEAISLAHGNYEDDDAEVIAEKLKQTTPAFRGKHRDGTPFTLAADLPLDHKAEAKRLADHEAILEEEDRVAAQKKRWIENAKPPRRVQTLDARGRAYGRGGRKTASARVWVFPGTGCITVNRKDFTEYFIRHSDREMIVNPFVATKTCGMFDVMAHVRGGGITGQAGAVRHGVSRALEKFCPELRPPLKYLGYITRDPRRKERKKIGLKKARKAPQWVKR